MSFARSLQERREAERAANMAGLMSKSVSVSTSVYGGSVAGPAAKPERLSDNTVTALLHKRKLAALGCMVCLRLHGPHTPGPVELHHLRKDGWGKGDYRTLMPLCVAHHRGCMGVHGLGTKGFAAHYGFNQDDLLADALRLLEAKS